MNQFNTKTKFNCTLIIMKYKVPLKSGKRFHLNSLFRTVEKGSMFRTVEKGRMVAPSHWRSEVLLTQTRTGGVAPLVRAPVAPRWARICGRHHE